MSDTTRLHALERELADLKKALADLQKKVTPAELVRAINEEMRKRGRAPGSGRP